MQKNSGKKQKNYLIAALASMIAFSTMAASVMSGCGESSESSAYEHETQIITQIETKVVTETQIVDKNGNPIDPNESGADSKSESSNSKGNSSQNSNNSSDNNSQNSDGSSSSKGGSSASSIKNPSASGTDSSSNNSDNSNNNSSSSSANKRPEIKPGDPDLCTIDGNKFKKGDTVTCVYKLKVPTVLENFEGVVKYDSKRLEVVQAKLVGDMKYGSMINKNIAGSIFFNGSDISDGYDYTEGGEFMTVKYKVKDAGTVRTSIKWVAACEFNKSNHNYIKDGKPTEDFKVSKTYSLAE